MTYLAILLAAVGGFAVGAVWYMSLSQQWMTAVGRTEEEIKADQNPLPFIIAFVAALSAATVMNHMFAAGGVTGVMRCLGYGAGIGAFIVMPWVVLHYAFAGRPKSLWWIDGGHTVAAFAVMGLVLGFFR